MYFVSVWVIFWEPLLKKNKLHLVYSHHHHHQKWKLHCHVTYGTVILWTLASIKLSAHTNRHTRTFRVRCVYLSVCLYVCPLGYNVLPQELIIWESALGWALLSVNTSDLTKNLAGWLRKTWPRGPVLSKFQELCPEALCPTSVDGVMYSKKRTQTFR